MSYSSECKVGRSHYRGEFRRCQRPRKGAEDHSRETDGLALVVGRWAQWPIQTAYDVNQWPTVYVLDAKGVIRYFDVRGKDLDRAVDTLLAEMEAGSNRDAAH